MTRDERFAKILVKLDRAEKHIRDLDVDVRSFLNTGPYTVRSEHDAKSSKRTFYVDSTTDVPDGILCIAGDAIHNLRSALDHLVCQLVLANGNSPHQQTSFPIFEDSVKYAAGSPGKIQGVGDEAVKLIDEIKPYKGGRLALWWLHQLDIIDKHRMLFAAGIRVSGHTPSPQTREEFAKSLAGSRADELIPDFNKLFMAVHPFPSVMKAGDVLLSGPDFEVEDDTKFIFDVSLNEPQIIENQPILGTIKLLANNVDRIVRGFRKCF